MQVNANQQNLINLIKTNKVLDADDTVVCQLIKHYREVVGQDFKIDLNSSKSNYYSNFGVSSVQFNGEVFSVNLAQRGLLGVEGTLPRMIGEKILIDYNNFDTAGADFIGIFEQRYYALNLISKNKYNLIRQKEEESFSKRNTQYKISDLLASFTGINYHSDFKFLDKKTLIKYSAFLGGKSNNVETLLRMLKDYFKLDFIAHYAPMQNNRLSNKVLSKLSSKNKSNNILGENIQLGSKVKMYGNYIQIKIAIKDKDEYERIYAYQNIFNAIHELITYFLGDKNVYSLSLLVNKSYLSKNNFKTSKLCLGRNICLSNIKNDLIVEIPIKREIVTNIEKNKK
jgi:predicted component of type VI protein secretion system